MVADNDPPGNRRPLSLTAATSLPTQTPPRPSPSSTRPTRTRMTSSTSALPVSPSLSSPLSRLTSTPPTLPSPRALVPSLAPPARPALRPLSPLSASTATSPSRTLPLAQTPPVRALSVASPTMPSAVRPRTTPTLPTPPSKCALRHLLQKNYTTDPHGSDTSAPFVLMPKTIFL